jgi:hypothetical protein
MSSTLFLGQVRAAITAYASSRAMAHCICTICTMAPHSSLCCTVRPVRCCCDWWEQTLRFDGTLRRTRILRRTRTLVSRVCRGWLLARTGHVYRAYAAHGRRGVAPNHVERLMRRSMVGAGVARVRDNEGTDHRGCGDAQSDNAARPKLFRLCALCSIPVKQPAPPPAVIPGS